MKRSAEEMGQILNVLYNEKFGDDRCEPYLLKWSDLRAIAGCGKLPESFITEINHELEEYNQALVPFDSFLVLTAEEDFVNRRRLPGRMLDRYLPGDGEDER